MFSYIMNLAAKCLLNVRTGYQENAFSTCDASKWLFDKFIKMSSLRMALVNNIRVASRYLPCEQITSNTRSVLGHKCHYDGSDIYIGVYIYIASYRSCPHMHISIRIGLSVEVLSTNLPPLSHSGVPWHAECR